MYEVQLSETFKSWLKSLKDRKAKTAILSRITRAEGGNLGSNKSVRPSINEMIIDVGKGYRVYFTKKGKKIVFLLNGGTKATQTKDIKKAEEMLKDIKNG